MLREYLQIETEVLEKYPVDLGMKQSQYHMLCVWLYRDEPYQADHEYKLVTCHGSSNCLSMAGQTSSLALVFICFEHIHGF